MHEPDRHAPGDSPADGDQDARVLRPPSGRGAQNDERIEKGSSPASRTQNDNGGRGIKEDCLLPGAEGGKPASPQRVERPLTIAELQSVLEMRLGFTVSINTLEKWCRNGKIFALRLGPEWRIPRETLEEIIKTALRGERF